MYPRSGFWYQGTSECALAPVFGAGEHPPKQPFWKPPFSDPPTLASLKKTRETPKKNKGFSLRGTPKFLVKGRKPHKKARKIGKQTKRKQGLEGQGLANTRKMFVFSRFGRLGKL